MDRPVTRPGGGGAGRPPGFPDRPDIADRPNRPGTDRPGLRPGSGGPDRPVNIDNIHVGNNNVINNRPQWANISRDRINNINQNFQGQLNDLQRWNVNHSDRMAGWRNWGDNIRDHWGHDHWHDGLFDHDWWHHHHHDWCGWHYGYWIPAYSWTYWWSTPTYNDVSSWFDWSAPAQVWSEPIYYDYGPGGNVTYDNDNVYVNGQPVATADEYAQSAMDLATVAPPANEEEAKQSEWMPLGTFAISTNQKDVDPNRYLQLAVNKEGVISGTLFNKQTDEAQTVQGQVDKETQRVAIRIGDSDQIVLETGLYNLTQDEVPVLVHIGTDQVENYLLVRLPAPEESQTAPQSPASNPR
jgi:hypothetical protein